MKMKQNLFVFILKIFGRSPISRRCYIAMYIKKGGNIIIFGGRYVEGELKREEKLWREISTGGNWKVKKSAILKI